MFHMEQKDYKLEIINELVKSKKHARLIAKNLGTNHTIIIRKLKELTNENVVDYQEEGRNKIYFLKNTIEAKSYVFTTENYNLTKILKKYPTLRSIIEKIKEDKRISLAILFGSYAKGIPKKESDIDIYVETNKKQIKHDLEKIDARINVKIGKYDKENLLIKEIEKNHIIIKGVEKYYEKNKFFE
ncbi:MAG: nucleotidyltransferase domain-containing protein [Nanoarchaeota archaeon]|nr:nucleotidyltransferase domain-containing protein [Nanoarchaeota archaeon]